MTPRVQGKEGWGKWVTGEDDRPGRGGVEVSGSRFSAGDVQRKGKSGRSGGAPGWLSGLSLCLLLRS